MNKRADRDVWLIGGGGHAKVAIASFVASGWNVRGVFDKNTDKWRSKVLDVMIEGDVPEREWWEKNRFQAFISIGSNRARRNIASELAFANWATAVHPTAVVHGSASVSPGVLVCASAVIHPDAVIGVHAIVNTAAIVEHDNRVGHFCHVGPRACLTGNVSIGEGAFIGAGAVILPGVSVGSWTVVGAGAVVIEDLPDNVVVAGVPARILKAQGG